MLHKFTKSHVYYPSKSHHIYTKSYDYNHIAVLKHNTYYRKKQVTNHTETNFMWPFKQYILTSSSNNKMFPNYFKIENKNT